MATKQIAWQTGSGNITLTYQGQGDGTITVQSDVNDGAARSQIITIETTKGSPVITKNLTIRQDACPVPVGTVLNYDYTGSYQEVELTAGQYKLQCWGAQGGSNGANSSYGITAKAGGKGGYSEGVITLSQKTTVRIYVGGQGTSSAGGYNGGGSTTGTSQRDMETIFGYSKMGGGGGSTDIRLSSGSLLSRMIVAGGGGGGAMRYKRETTSSTVIKTPSWYISPSAPSEAKSRFSISISSGGIDITKNAGAAGVNGVIDLSSYNFPVTVSFTYTLQGGAAGDFGLWYTPDINLYQYTQGGLAVAFSSGTHNVSYTFTDPSKPYVGFYGNDMNVGTSLSITSTEVSYTQSSSTTSTDGNVGGFGGGLEGGGLAENCRGKQNAAGNEGEFGYGANQESTNYMFASGAGGGGWYGGGRLRTNDTPDYTKYSGGGSGWVNIAANASYRPSGYTGLQLDSGTTYAGNTSFPAPGGGNETGHSGNGYARITRLS